MVGGSTFGFFDGRGKVAALRRATGAKPPACFFMGGGV